MWQPAFFLVADVTGQVWGATIPIVNAGFENPTLADGGSTPSAPGWISIPAGNSGIQNPTTLIFPGEAPEGQNVAYINTLPNQTSVLEQTLLATIAPGIEYTLQVDVGRRLDQAGLMKIFAPRIQLQTAAGTVLASSGCLHGNFGSFLTCTATYTAPTSGGAVGQALKISLQSIGGSLSTEQANFDNVRLTAVPLPAAVYLFGFGLIGFIGLARRKITS
jgi:hypothetical protein